MPIELTCMKAGGALVPVADIDRSSLDPVKNGQGYKVVLKVVGTRAIKHHRLYWAGLVPLVADYWDEIKTTRSAYDSKLLRQLAGFLKRYGFNPDPFIAVFKLFLDDRASRCASYVTEHKSKTGLHNAIHQWIKDGIGAYDAFETPTGVVKSYHSINFNAMSQEEFEIFYAKAIDFVWVQIFSKVGFSSPEEADNLAHQIMDTL